jgi:hypothetical protein
VLALGHRVHHGHDLLGHGDRVVPACHASHRLCKCYVLTT